MEIVYKFGNAYIRSFLDRYAGIINKLPKGKYERYNIGESEDHCIFRYSLYDDNTPFGTCDDRIAINEKQCEKLGLDDNERDACLFHEIGHILYPVEQDGLNKELAADNLAMKYGLGTHLISALKKMVASDVFKEEARKEMTDRIEHWSKELKLN